MNPNAIVKAYSIRVAAVFLMLLIKDHCLGAQDKVLNFDWATRPTGAGQSLTAPPLSIPATTTFKINITNTDNLLYSYRLDCKATVQAGPDLGPLTNLFLQGNKLEGACDTSAMDLSNAIKKAFDDATICGTSCPSLSLSQTRSEVFGFVNQIDSLSCKPSESLANGLKQQEDKLKELLSIADHTVSFDAAISPDYKYSCQVTELYKGTPTTNGALTIDITPTNNMLTLSVGALFSSIENRSYSAVSIPNSAGTGTMNVLGVQGNSFSSDIAALANFRIPFWKLYSEKVGLDVAAGPTYKIDSKSGATPVGFFGGLSFRLYKYFFLTPGVHIGSFADYPAGFSAAGQPIPPNFPTPTGVTRTTAKFGVAVSFQTKDFSSLGKTTATTSNPAAGNNANSTSTKNNDQGGGTQKNPPTPGAGNGADTQNGVQQPAKGVAVPNSIELGSLGAIAVVRQLELQNNDAVPATIKFDPQNFPLSLKLGDSESCLQLQPGKTCSVSLTLAPGTPSGTAILTVFVNSVPKTVKITWSAN